MAQGLNYGPLGRNCVHVCVDMQKLFDEGTEWATPWMRRVLPNVEAILRGHAAQTIFTRFVPARRPGEGEGTWKRYYERWASMTIEAIGEDMIDLLPPLREFVPPATVIDKKVYSPWLDSGLEAELKRRGTDTLMITGGETDVCVLGTVLGAVDRGYRTVIVADALCSSADETHDASMKVYHDRYGQQVETIDTADLIKEWR